MEIFEYKGKEIELDYSEKYIENIKSPLKVRSFARGVLRKYDRLEKKVLERLIEKSIKRSPRYNLVAIKGIKHRVENIFLNGEMGLSFMVEGYAVYTKNRN
jgi:hypothetical protein